MREPWSRLNAYAMRREPWTICKKFVDGCTLYQVWKDGIAVPLAHKNDFQEAQDWIASEGAMHE